MVLLLLFLYLIIIIIILYYYYCTHYCCYEREDICSLIRQMLAAEGSMQTSGLIRVLGLVASILPSLLLTETGCVCEAERFPFLNSVLILFFDSYSPLIALSFIY